FPCSRLSACGAPRALHSLPTRRSSDLGIKGPSAAPTPSVCSSFRRDNPTLRLCRILVLLPARGADVAEGVAQRNPREQRPDVAGTPEFFVNALHRAGVALALHSAEREPDPLVRDAVGDVLGRRELLDQLDAVLERTLELRTGARDLTGGIDLAAPVGDAVATDRVVVLEGEAERVDQGVARGAGRIFHVLRVALARGGGAARRGRRVVHGGRRRRDRLAEQVLANDDA